MMNLHKLSAGNGYTYLTRQVAANDAADTGYANLGEYYSERGESPGVWLGRGLAGLDGGPQPGDVVHEAQMVALFGHGRHPNADALEQRAAALGAEVGHEARQAIRGTRGIERIPARAGAANRRPQPRTGRAAERAGRRRGPGTTAVRARPRVVPPRSRARTARRARAHRLRHRRVPARQGVGRRLRPDVLAGQERVGAVGLGRSGDGAGDRGRARRSGARRRRLARARGGLHTGRCGRPAAGGHPRAARRRVHASRLPCRRPRSAHARR